MGQLTVIAFGGNALLDPDLPLGIDSQFAVAARAVKPIADLVAASAWPDRIVLTHGNGPQVGFQALRSELSKDELFEVPLDALVADTQGNLGYTLQRALREELLRRGLAHNVVSVITEVEADPDDDAFKEPTKPIGRFYTEAEAQILGSERGWGMKEDPHRGWRRVVPSPAPVRIVQLESIARLTDQRSIVICCGGGGIPVMRMPDGSIVGLEAVIDKDRASALLGVRLGAQRLIITTAVDGVYQGFMTPSAKRFDTLNLTELRALADAGEFPPGSMGPKVKAADRFLTHGGRDVIICKPEALMDAWHGHAGTRIVPG
ncbi:MAG: carbamate kinase [Myxococcota bacterium]